MRSSVSRTYPFPSSRHERRGRRRGRTRSRVVATRGFVPQQFQLMTGSRRSSPGSAECSAADRCPPILNLNRCGRNPHNLVAAVDDFALARNENVSVFGKKNFLGSPVWLAKPKNFSGIGGGCATAGGGVYRLSIRLAFVGLCRGLAESESPRPACDTKIFLPEPSYLICSARGQLLQVQRGVEVRRRAHFLRRRN